jgi:hypothetical protein
MKALVFWVVIHIELQITKKYIPLKMILESWLPGLTLKA